MIDLQPHLEFCMMAGRARFDLEVQSFSGILIRLYDLVTIIITGLMWNMQSQEPLSYQQISEGEQQRDETTAPVSKGQKWTKQENKAYLEYLEQNFFLFKTERLRKQYEVFSELGKLIGTRTSKQVKTHHNRMLRRYKSLEQILRELPNTMEMEQLPSFHQFKRQKSSKHILKMKVICIELEQQQKREKQSPVSLTVEQVQILEESTEKQDWMLVFEF